MKPPIFPEVHVPVLAPDEQRALLAACDRVRRPPRRRHHPSVLDTGMRITEQANLAIIDIDIGHRVADVMGSGRDALELAG